jgi:hypothetical protein
MRLIALLALLLVAQPDERPSSRSRVPSSLHGRIDELLIHHAGQYDEALPTFEDLLRSLSDQTRITVVVENVEGKSRFKKLVKVWKIRRPERIRYLNMNHDITVWARDRFIARSRIGWSILVPSFRPHAAHSGRGGDCRVPSRLHFLDPALRFDRSELDIEGGNVSADRKHVFVGWSTISQNSKTLGGGERSEREVRDLLEEALGKPMVILGGPNVCSPNDHIDMFFTPVGNGTVLLGDPALGIECLKRRDLGNVCAKHWQLDSQAVNAMAVIEFQLKRAGYRIVRIPMIVSVGSDSPWVTYNNVLMEERAGRRIVYLPKYDLPSLDERAQATWKSLGFTVKPIRASKLSRLAGAVRCATNVLRRSEDLPPGIWADPSAPDKARSDRP